MGKEERNIKKSFIRYAIVVTVLCVVFLLLKKDNLFRWIQTGFTLRSQQKQIEALKDDNMALDERIKDLTGNRDSLERYARETYGFCEEGEDVYIVE